MIVHVANALPPRVAQDCPAMPTNVIVSYDGTTNDDDGLSLARMLAAGGAQLSLAYVRHTREYDPRREEIAEHDAHRRLEHGVTWLEQPDTPTHVVIDPSTGTGLAKLAAAENASLVVFGSDYRTAPGRVEPGGAAQQMLTGGEVPVAVAVAGLRTDANSFAIHKIAVSEPTADDDAPRRTAESLARALGAEVVGADDRSAELLVVGSQSAGRPGRIALSGSTRAQLDSASSSVIVLPRGTAIEF
jgi:nucleotide-binding universal stress UspA family protein